MLFLFQQLAALKDNVAKGGDTDRQLQDYVNFHPPVSNTGG